MHCPEVKKRIDPSTALIHPKVQGAALHCLAIIKKTMQAMTSTDVADNEPFADKKTRGIIWDNRSADL